jgi:hypothetical protein
MVVGWPPERETLHEWRQVGDPPADDFIRGIFDDHGHEGVRSILESILDQEWVAEDEIGRRAEEFIGAQRRSALGPDPTDLESRIKAGQAVFAEHGPEIMLILGCYSLPAAYAAANGVKVLRMTDYLTRQPDRRLVETAQVIVDVMQPGGLLPGGIGVLSAEKTRLMHAAIRHLIVHRPEAQWDTAAWGVPINQEDLAATLMTFSYVVIDGLDRIGVTTSADEKESYLTAWREVGRLMGVVPDLLPANFAEAEQLTRAIEADQVLHDVPPSDPRWQDGQTMTQPLLRVLESKTLPGVPSALMRLFLPPDVAEGLGVPRRVVRDWIVQSIVRWFGWLDRTFLDARFRRSRALRSLSMGLMNLMLEWERGGNREPFRLPDSLDWYETDGRRTFGQWMVGASATFARRA